MGGIIETDIVIAARKLAGAVLAGIVIAACDAGLAVRAAGRCI